MSARLARAAFRAGVAALVLGGGLVAAPPARADDALAGLPELSAGGLRVYLIRHGQALSNLDPAPNLPAEQLDHLTPLGKQQAEAAGRALAGRGVSAVISSPASRARETALGVAQALGLEAKAVEPRLRPMALGHAAGGRALTWKDRGAEWEKGRDLRPAEGESLEDVGDRVADCVRALARSRRGASVVLVAHGEVIAAYLGRVRGTPAPKRYPFALGQGSISVVDVGATGSETVRLANVVPAAQ